MPLRAIRGEESVLAFNYDEMSWRELKETYQGTGLRMPCCASPAIPCTSPLNNFYFRHQARGECSSAPESPEHVYLKTLVCIAAKQAGWRVMTEWRGTSPEGNQWIADVYCEHEGSRVAIEIQLSSQTFGEFVHRQERYKASGVKAAWLAASYRFRHLQASDQLPVFHVGAVQIGQDPPVEEFGVTVTTFVGALLGGKIRWGLDPYKIFYVGGWCRNCKKEVFLVYGFEGGGHIDCVSSHERATGTLERVHGLVGNDWLKEANLCVISKVELIRQSKTIHSNACPSCETLINNNQLAKIVKNGRGKNGHVLCKPPQSRARWKLISDAP